MVNRVSEEDMTFKFAISSREENVAFTGERQSCFAELLFTRKTNTQYRPFYEMSQTGP